MEDTDELNYDFLDPFGLKLHFKNYKSSFPFLFAFDHQKLNTVISLPAVCPMQD